MSELNDLQRANLLQLYKSKLQQLGDDKFFNKFDEIREECYETLGILSEDKMRNLQIVRMCTYEDTKLVVNSIPAEVDCSWCDAKAGDTHAMSCQYGERYKQAEEILAQSISFYVDPVHSAASTLGRQGGKVKSEPKSNSSRSNGKKGGRPKVNKSLDMEDI